MDKGNRKKYLAGWKANGRGVDLNRNFDAGWKECGSALLPGREGYKGRYPHSEREVRAILKAASMYKPWCCVSLHSSGNLIYWNYGSEGELLRRDRALGECVSGITGYELCSTLSNGTARAGCGDYFMERLGIPSVTIETGQGECPLGQEEFSSIYKRCGGLLKGLGEFYRGGRK